MDLKEYKLYIVTSVVALITIIVSLFFRESKSFFLIIGTGILIGIGPFIYKLIHDNKVADQKEEAFLEFARNLVESVKAGTPISKSILNVRKRDYGVLSPNVRKLANQITMGIPLNHSLKVFSDDINNKVISRAITLIGQAERAGGDIGEILESVAGAVTISDKLKKERRASISTLVVQGYIIFFIFMIIILVMQFRIIPLVSGIANIGGGEVGGIVGVTPGTGISQEEISGSFLYLLLVQGFFSGLAIGKLAEGNAKAGIKHSFVLMVSSFLVSAIANLFL